MEVVGRSIGQIEMTGELTQQISTFTKAPDVILPYGEPGTRENRGFKRYKLFLEVINYKITDDHTELILEFPDGVFVKAHIETVEMRSGL